MGDEEGRGRRPAVGLRHQVRRPPVDIEFTDLTYTIPDFKNGSKIILKSLSGFFKSGQLTAILGPSGAGKSTLLNVLAGYRTSCAGGTILVNGLQRELRQFRKLSRYIMQEDVHQPELTVQECMMVAADLKLGTNVCDESKEETISEILEILRLKKSRNTVTSQLSGGEKKRLSIAQELVNNPPVLFLDEPTTGLDDVSSSQCITLLKRLAQGGRTIICSIHTPSARLFSLFDNVYIVAEGQCVYQGRGDDIVPYLSSFGLHCPKHYNPADFMIEVSSGEYGDHTERMVMAIDNGKCKRWNCLLKPAQFNKRESELELGELKQIPEYGCSMWTQFFVLFKRMTIQSWRDLAYVTLKAGTQILVGLLIGSLFYQMGNDGSKTIFNFGYCFVSIIAFMYIPMLPALIWFPQEVKLLKREYFNRWYSLNSYYTALTMSRLPVQLVLVLVYVAITYIMTDQPMEWQRILKFIAISILMTLVSEAFGLAISAQLNIVNGIFVGPSLSVPLMLLAVYGLGTGSDHIPILIKIAMHGSYLRFGLEGLIVSVYGGNRPQLICPDSEIYCHLNSPKALMKEVGMEKAEFWFAFIMLCVYYVLFQLVCYLGLKFRLCRNKNLGYLGVLIHYLKSYFNVQGSH